uniref:Putative trypsin-like peptidase domain containing protein n=1 Tax=viral metagenome TaxID=1070528 RepID=A0A6M3IEM9_9ZZZZ
MLNSYQKEELIKIHKRRKKILSFKNFIKTAVILTGGIIATNYVVDTGNKINELEAVIESHHKADGLYDNDMSMVTDFNNITNAANCVYEIESETTYLSIEGDGIERTIEGGGTGLLLKNDTILTADHVLDPKSYHSDMFRGFKGTLKDAKYFLIINGERYEFKPIEHELYEKDLGIGLMVEDINTAKYEGTIGDCRDLRRGNVLYVAGAGGDVGVRLRDGIYSGKIPDTDLYNFSNSVNFGDSGGPVFAIKDGEVELVGVMVQGRGTGFGLLPDINIFEGIEGKL